MVEEPRTVTEPQTFAYESDGASTLTLDVFAPTRPGESTAVLLLHGGGWRGGTPTTVYARAAALAQRGLTAVAVQYRLLGAAAWPGALRDVQAAIDWTRENAAVLGIVPSRIVLQGHSAGAHLALLAAAERVGGAAPISAVVAFYPIIGLHASAPPAEAPPGLPEMEQAEDGTIASHLLLGADCDPALISGASPIQQIRPGFPPTLILHGASDQLIRAFSSVLLFERIRECGGVVDLHILAGQNHEFDRAPRFLQAVTDEIAFFIERYVTAVEQVRAEGHSLSPFPSD